MTKRPDRAFLQDRGRMGRVLLVAGLVGALAALVVGIVGWIVADRATDGLEKTVGPVGDVVDNVADSVDASEVMLTRTIAAIEGIEAATRSSARTLNSVTDVLADASEVIGGDLADTLESAVDTFPALIDTGRVIDRTMSALSLIGVDYDPDVPLDQSLTELEESLSPVPDQLRTQAEALVVVEEDIDQIVADAGSLAAVLLEARIDMLDAERILESVGQNMDEAGSSIAAIEEDLDRYRMLARVVVVATSVALLAAASAPLLLGLHYRRASVDS